MQEFIIGVDEVGRGCLAGPVYAAAVVFKSEIGTGSFKDSKTLSARRREDLSKIIHQEHWVAISSATPREIDEINILQASFLAMRRAIDLLVQKLPSGGQIGVVVDGHLLIPGLTLPQEAVVQGDQLIPQISAASIVAKVERDQLMKTLAKAYPQYGLEKHKGYPSAVHKAAIAKWGPTEMHRRSFKGVKEWLTDGSVGRK